MLRRTGILMGRNRWLQIGGLIAIWWASEALVHAIGLPVPGGVVGMAFLLILLGSGQVRIAWFRRGSTGLLDHMLLFFVPATMALLDHPELFSLTGLKVLAVIFFGTLIVMVGTALVVEACFRWSVRHAR
ncbi:CidA/LrgA family protein [Telmatospirillum siberiense]|uniref:CidA/LrgA family protein n=1 Tax=Telmatospirillum siberiense TaxID=382514 RepID=A0A2N3PVE6_9PROT|nr:CidA/LrgA family protein [Telmatospirillum siberiense]PKU24368.1 CidA/LrgA family protein [Telmatospirillum siberiense]